MSRRYTLTLLRHAKSSWDDSSLSDHDRPLNERGDRDAPEMGRRLKERGIRPSALVASSATRTRHTARHVAQAIGFPTEFIHIEKTLYHASAEQILKVIGEQDAQFQNLLVVGHNPGISDLAERLSNGLVVNMPTAGMLTISADLGSWDELPYVAHTVVGYDFPKNASGVITR
ncbi:MAG: histidine phosphatase family protein [Pseudomonadota bacterium]